jgi:hypothetical protein
MLIYKYYGALHLLLLKSSSAAAPWYADIRSKKFYEYYGALHLLLLISSRAAKYL